MKEYTVNPNNYQIMIVDDENLIRLITEDALTSLGYKVMGFEKPVDAVQYYQENYRNIDFVILDMMMPVMNGADVFYKLKQINPFLLAVVLSGYDDVEKQYHYLLGNGLCGFLKKPINITTLDQEIKANILNNLTINPAKGLETLLNRESIYTKLLKVYHEENRDLEEKITMLIEANDLEGIESLVHKIKGISLNIGACDSYFMTTELHHNLKNNRASLEDIQTFVKYHNIIIKDIERILGDINV